VFWFGHKTTFDKVDVAKVVAAKVVVCATMNDTFLLNININKKILYITWSLTEGVGETF
jgi:hypothetical protein